MAARFWVSGGTGNTNSTTNWSATSGGASGASVPISTDDVTFDANGNSNATVNATHTWLSLTITSGYTATMTHNAQLSIGGGGWNYSSTYTIAGTSSILIYVSCTITSGQSWPNSLTFQNAITITLVNNLIISGSIATTNLNVTVNSTTTETITCTGISVVLGFLGTAKLILKGGSISGAGSFSKNIDIDGNVTISSFFRIGAITLTYISGTVTTTGGTLLIIGSCTLNTNGITWNAITNQGANTITLTSNLTCTGLLSTGTLNATFNKTTAETVTIGGLAGSLNLLGTCEFFINGGTWSGALSVGVNFNINGNVTISGTVTFYNNVTLKYLSGTVTTTASTLVLGGSCIVDTAGMSWNNITLSGTAGQTYTINSLMSASGTLTIVSTAQTFFAGSAGFTVGTLSCGLVAAATISLKESITYTITTLLSCYLSRTGSVVLFTSSHGSTKANLTLVNGAECRCLANFTRIDSSGGRPIRTFNGVLTSTENIVSITDLQTVGSSF